MAGHVFISYSRKDQDYVRKLEEDLRKRGFEVWIDERIDYGDRWWRTVVEAIRVCAAFIVVMTPDSEKSEWVEREIHLAMREGKEIFPLLLRGEEFGLLIDRQYADVRDRQMPPQDFYDGLREVLPVPGVPEPRREESRRRTFPSRLSLWQKWPLTNIITGVAVFVAIVACIGTWLLAPDFPRWAGLEPSSTPSAPTSTATATAMRPTAPALPATPTKTTLPTATPTRQPTPTPAIEEMQQYVFVEQTTAYRSPGEEYGYILRGKTFVILEEQDGWIRIQMIRTEDPDWQEGAVRWIQKSETAYIPFEEAPIPPEQAPTSTATSVPFGDLVGDMILIPAGEFAMGSDEGWDQDKPLHDVYLDAFYIGKYPITNVQYKRFVDAAGHEAPDRWSGGSIPEGKEDHPVVWVSWYDARAYCQWLADQTGQVVRLPTEAEWEKAARGTDGREYPWGNEFDESKGNTQESGIGDTTPVRKYSPEGDSPYGVADMAGNVYEWTSSMYEFYPYEPDDGREDPEAEGDRALRGGSFIYNHWYVRCAARKGLSPNARSNTVGFRVVVSPGSP